LVFPFVPNWLKISCLIVFVVGILLECSFVNALSVYQDIPVQDLEIETVFTPGRTLFFVVWMLGFACIGHWGTARIFGL